MEILARALVQVAGYWRTSLIDATSGSAPAVGVPPGTRVATKGAPAAPERRNYCTRSVTSKL